MEPTQFTENENLMVVERIIRDIEEARKDIPLEELLLPIGIEVDGTWQDSLNLRQVAVLASSLGVKLG